MSMLIWVWGARLALRTADVGAFPQMKADVLFYALLAVVGIATFAFYVRVGEARPLSSLPWGFERPWRQLAGGCWCWLPPW